MEVLFNVAFSGLFSPGQFKLLRDSNLAADPRLFLRNYRVATVVVLPVGRYPGAVITEMTAAIGTPSHETGATVWFDVQNRLKVDSQK